VTKEKLQNALRQVDELKARNRELQAKLIMAATGEKTQCLQSKRLQIVWWSVTQ
jgi:hypothetical protein